MSISDKTKKKNKGLTFVSNAKDEESQVDLDTDERLSNTILLLGKQFNKTLKIIDRRERPNVKNISFDINNNYYSQKNTRTEDKSNQSKDIQCYEC